MADWYAGSYERATAIFDRAARRFHPVLALETWTVRDDAIELILKSRGGRRLRGRLSFPDAEVLRLQWRFAGAPGPHVSEMLEREPACLRPKVDDDGDRLIVTAGGSEVQLQKYPWRVRFGEFTTEPQDNSMVEPVNEAGGWAFTNDARVQAYETFALRPHEQLVGLGERFLGPGLRGRRLAHWIDEPFGANTTDRVHKSVPMIVSSRGYGLFFHHAEEASFDLGAVSSASASVLVDAPELDYFVFLGSPKEILRRYTDLTGRAPVPPEWSFGVWMSKCMYKSRQEVEDVLAHAEQLDFPIDVIGLDPQWMANQPGLNYPLCDFVWNERDFGPMSEFIETLHARDVRLCLWISPCVSETNPAFVPERFVSHGGVRDPNHPDLAFVDFTGDGRDWWKQELKRLLDGGVDAFKLDFGESLPVDGRLADGRIGVDMHNAYPLLASMTAAEAGVRVFFTRAGTAGSQRYPLHWSGDAQSTWAGMAGALRGALALAWSGFAHWTSDIGGFYRLDPPDEVGGEPALSLPDPELYIRWMQWGLLCSHSRFHGILGREPWRFGDEAVAIGRDFAALRRRLRPYLVRCAREAADRGVPVLRPMALEFPEQPEAWHIDTQYLLGPDLVVCPVLEAGGRVDVYIPPGTWNDYFTGKSLRGPAWIQRRQVPLEQLPLLVRDGAEPFA